jgi:hypothetical protein
MSVFVLSTSHPIILASLLQPCQDIYVGNVVYPQNIYVGNDVYPQNIYVGNDVYPQNIYVGNDVYRLKRTTAMSLSLFRVRSNCPAILVGVVSIPDTTARTRSAYGHILS